MLGVTRDMKNKLQRIEKSERFIKNSTTKGSKPEEYKRREIEQLGAEIDQQIRPMKSFCDPIFAGSRRITHPEITKS